MLRTVIAIWFLLCMFPTNGESMAIHVPGSSPGGNTVDQVRLAGDTIVPVMGRDEDVVALPSEGNTPAVKIKVPTAEISGDQDICEGDSAMLTVKLSGRHPWEITVSDGDNLVRYSNIDTSPFTFWVSPTSTTTYTVVSVRDATGLINKGTGSATVVVNPVTSVSITGLDPSYNVEADPVPLYAQPQGGSFSGPGVTGPPWYFDPGIAGSVNSPHTIYYSFTNEYGCTSLDDALVYVLAPEGEVKIPRDLYCSTDKPFTITATNSAGVTGTFTLLNSSGNQVNGLTDNHDNTASANPGVLSQDTYIILYRYVQMGTTLSIRKSFKVDVVIVPGITEPKENVFCRNERPMELRSDISKAVFSGPGVTGDINKGFLFNPSLANTGDNILTCTYTTVNGCVASTNKVISLKYVPETGFSTDKTCVGDGDTVYFTNLTSDIGMITSWNWDFGDPESGNANHSTQESPWHIYRSAGTTVVSLVATTQDGCIDTLRKNVGFTPRPSGGFHAVNDCYTEGHSTSFKSDLQPSSSIKLYRWTFFLPDGQTETITGNSEVNYPLEGVGEHKVELYAESDPGCSSTFTKSIYLKPTIALSNGNYIENFEYSGGNWMPEGDVSSGNQPWSLGIPGYDGLNDNSDPAWYISVNSATRSSSSYLSSPCFDLSGLDRPMIKLEFFRSFEKDRDGAVLQASVDNETWVNVGEIDDGLNWYNSDNIQAYPARQFTGWTGVEPFSPDSTWVIAGHDLNALSGAGQVRFRLAYAHDTSSFSGKEGLALNSVQIKNRTRNVLLEHFTNSGDDDCRTVNAEVNNLFSNHFKDLVKLEYHTDFPGYDPFFENNPAVPATRTLYYGVTTVPYSILEGGTGDRTRFDYTNTGIFNTNDIMLQALEDPEFTIDLKVSRDQEQVTADITIMALKEQPAEERILHVAVFEKLISDVTTGNGETDFLNVVKTLLPNAAGTAVFDGWRKGETRHYLFTWKYEHTYDKGMIRIAAFLQDDNSRKVYQVVTDDTTNISTGIVDLRPGKTGFNLYPNPASNRVNITVETSGNDKDLRIEFYDQIGRMVKSIEWQPGDLTRVIDLNGLKKGLYYVVMKEKSGLIQNGRKLVILN